MVKDKFPMVPIHEPTQVVLNKSIVKKNRRHKEQSNSDLNLANKRIEQAGNVFAKISTNFNTFINSNSSLSNL